ncbi:MAG: choice-of-anchor V domain-containing protein [Balneolaceae bacterium]|nr:choice-of-anchor V domain-containing protein [Balneolaceae bacterium]
MIKITILPVFCLLIGMLLVPNRPNKEPISPFYPEELPGTFTGGFGEDTCHSCHFDYPLNPEEGSLSLNGIPENYEKEKTYTITVTVSREDLGQAGFQITSRFSNGKQAGSFSGNSDQVQFTRTENQIEYLQHSLKGSKVNNSTTQSWEFIWEAPSNYRGEIIFNIAANAGNGDASAFGDYIFTDKITVMAK